MATTNLGKVSVTPKGEYDPLITYERLDIISHNGSSYIVKQASTGVTPIEGEFYALIAEKGDGGSFLEKSYKTYAAMELDKPNLTANISTRVSNDSDATKNGSYTYDGTVFTRSQYDSKVVMDKIIADAASAVQDAINNTAVEGGVLADTFVTATANGVGAIARTQRDKNSDTVSVKDFGALGNGDDATDAFVSAINTGKTVWIPDGHYKLRVDNNSSINGDLKLESNGAKVEIVEGSATSSVFNISNCDIVRLKGIHFFCNIDNNNENKLLTCSLKTALIDEFEVSECRFKGNMSLIVSSGSYTQMPDVTPYGFKSLKVNDNKVTNLTRSFMTINNFPILHAEVCRNVVHNWVGAFASFGITNGTDNGYALQLVSNFYAKDNIGLIDDNHWSESVGSYHCFLLVEGWSVVWENNAISGLKSRTTASVCDSYLSCINVVSKNNTTRNVASFNVEPAVGRNIFFAKADGTSSIIPYKEFRGNSFVIERPWLDTIGEEYCAHTLCNFGVRNAGIVVVEDNYINVDVLHSNHRNKVISLQFRKNNINARLFTKDSEGKSARFLNLWKADAVGYSYDIDISGNSINTPADVDAGLPSVFYAGSADTVWDTFVYKDNYVFFGNDVPNAVPFFHANALRTVNTGNTFVGNFNRGYTSTVLKDAEYFNNSVITGNSYGAILLSQVGLQGNSIINETYTGNFADLKIDLLDYIGGVLPIEDTSFLVSFKFRNKDTDFSISFKYDVKRVGDGFHVYFTDRDDAPYDNKIGVEASRFIKSNYSGVGSTGITAWYTDRTSSSVITLSSTTTIARTFGRFEVTLESFPIA